MKIQNNPKLISILDGEMGHRVGGEVTRYPLVYSRGKTPGVVLPPCNPFYTAAITEARTLKNN